MARAVDQGLELKAASDVKRAHPFRSVELAAGNRKQIDPEFADLRRDFSNRLRCIGVKTDIILACDRADFLDRLDCADLVCWRA